MKLEELEGESFIAFDTDLIIRKKIDAAFRRAKVEVRVAMEFDNVETMKQAVQIGAGVSILPAPTVRQAADAGAVTTVRFDPPELVRPVGIVHRKDRPLSVAALKFIELLSQKHTKVPEPAVNTSV